jgi:hypothetical protein
MACVIKGITKENADKIFKYMSHAEKRKLDDELGTLDAKPEDIFASMVRTIEITRKMIKTGEIRLDKIDPDMMIAENFEEQLLSQGAAPAHAVYQHGYEMTVTPSTEEAPVAQEVAPAPKKKAEAGEVDSKTSAEIMQLHKALTAINRENTILKEELRALREKLDQIRRIA